MTNMMIRAVEELACEYSRFYLLLTARDRLLAVRLVLDRIQRDCKPRCYYVGIETRREKTDC